MDYVRSRGSWGARYPDGDLTLSGTADEVFVHHTVTAQLSPDASVAQEEAQMRSIEGVGQSRFGTGISYNVIIFPSGRAYQGVSWNRRGTHTGGRNSTARSICFAGNYEVNEPTDAQIATAGRIYAEGKGSLWKSGAPLRGHRDVSQTACPGINVYEKIDEIRSGNPQEEEDMDAEDKQIAQDTLWNTRKVRETLNELAPVLWNVRQTKANTDEMVRDNAAQKAQIAGLVATVVALGKSVDLGKDEVLATLDAAVRETLSDIESVKYTLNVDTTKGTENE